MPVEAGGIAREHVEAFIADLFAHGRSASTAKTRYGGLQVFFRWLVDEGEITRSPMERMRPRQVPDQPVDVLDDGAVRRLLALCSGRDFAAVRDTAVIRVLIDSGMRVSEMAGLRVDDLDFEMGTALVLGKGRPPHQPAVDPCASRTLSGGDHEVLRARRTVRAYKSGTGKKPERDVVPQTPGADRAKAMSMSDGSRILRSERCTSKPNTPAPKPPSRASST
jgi:integrase